MPATTVGTSYVSTMATPTTYAGAAIAAPTSYAGATRIVSAAATPYTLGTSTIAAPTTYAATTVAAPVTTLTSAPSYYMSAPVSYQTLPTIVSSVTVAAPQAQSKGKVDSMRVTIVPIKADAEAPLTKFVNGKEVSESIASTTGVKMISSFFTEDKMVVAALYDSVENLEAGLSVNAKLLAQVADNFTAAPVRYQGEVCWSYKGPGKAGGASPPDGRVASRVSIFQLKPGSQQEILKITAQVEALLKDEALSELIDVQSIFADDDMMIMMSRFHSMKGLETSTEKMGEIMAPMGPFMAGWEDFGWNESPSLSGTVAWSHPKAFKIKKRATNKGCC